MQSATGIALTKLDCLSGYDPLLICTHYEYKGKLIERFPINAILEECKPVYEEMKGWTEDISTIRQFDNLPDNARKYALEIERLIEVPIKYISVSPERTSGTARVGSTWRGRSARIESSRYRQGVIGRHVNARSLV